MDLKNRIALIWPRVDKGFYDFNPLTAIFGGKGQFIPLPLLTVAASLGEEWKFNLIDEQINPLNKEVLNGFDYVFISVNFLQLSATLKIIALAHEMKKPIIVGGPLLSTLPDLIPPSVTKVIGEIESPEISTGEKLSLVLSADMKKGMLKNEYSAHGHPDVKKVPPPRYDLLENKPYFNFSMQTSRGCHHHCSFCQIPCLYGKHQRKTASQVYKELSLVNKYGGGDRTIFIIDDNFIGDISNLQVRSELLEVIDTIFKWQSEHGFPYDFFVQCSLDIAEHENVIEAMARAGINMMFLGIETLNTTILKSMRKTQNLGVLQEHDQIENTTVFDCQIRKVEKLRSYGMGVFAGFMIGFDEDHQDSADNIIRFLEFSKIPIAGLTILQAPPGTPLYRKMRECNRISTDLSVLTQPFRTNVIFKRDRESFYNDFLYCVENIYGARQYFSRCYEWMKKWNDAYLIKGRKGSISANFSLRRLFRSFWRQGVLSPYRIEYWKYLIKICSTFYSDYNRISISLYLGYFYEIMSDNLVAARYFVKNLPGSLTTEWNSTHN
jgi:radical SAM superfamily enzyme YgiQ (UPF0313 family)